VEVTVKKLRKM